MSSFGKWFFRWNLAGKFGGQILAVRKTVGRNKVIVVIFPELMAPI